MARKENKVVFRLPVLRFFVQREKSRGWCASLPFGLCALRIKGVALLIASVLLFGVLLIVSGYAYAETTDTNASPDELQKTIEETAKSYDEATKLVNEAQEAVLQNEQKIQEIQEKLPYQIQKSNDALIVLYKMQGSEGGLLDLLINAKDLMDALSIFEYISHIQDKNLSEIAALKNMQAELESAQDQLVEQRTNAELAQQQVSTALENAKAAREEAQRRAEEQAAADRAVLEQARNESNEPESEASNPSGVDWSSDKDSFINEWGVRIDSYLAGSPLAGQGRTFAEAAWNYGVDPRYSPAISNTESSKGLYCFNSCNAWGWGSSSWGSWEEAIDSHVRGLASGYGSTISVEAAQKYCPPNWYHWYSATSGQMDMM